MDEFDKLLTGFDQAQFRRKRSSEDDDSLPSSLPPTFGLMLPSS
jgi:hypothetical protein